MQREETAGGSFREVDREVAFKPRTKRHMPSRLRRRLPRYREEGIRAGEYLQRAEEILNLGGTTDE
ncbi:MAG: hypothetical protein K2N63_01050 [Lachnospiraceae bacterium]|nr:hypothetical protein [Lachnospiraceae bacterium]